MLKIRLTRTGKKGQPSFRVVVAEKTKAVKGKYLEILGHYLPARNPKKVELKKDRIEYWLSKGAQPSDTAASLLKNNGIDGMDKFMEPRDKQRKSKKAQEEAPAPKAAAAEAGDAPAAEAAPAEAAEPAPAAEEPKAEEAPKEEAPAA